MEFEIGQKIRVKPDYDLAGLRSKCGTVKLKDKDFCRCQIGPVSYIIAYSDLIPHQFEVGNRVRVIDVGDNIPENVDRDKYKERIGQEFVITQFHRNSFFQDFVSDESDFWFHWKCLELVQDNAPQPIQNCICDIRTIMMSGCKCGGL